MAASSAALLGSVCGKHSPLMAQAAASRPEIIDIHQHTNYWGRSDAALLHHQKVMGVTHTILLPAGTTIVAASAGNHGAFASGVAHLTNQWVADGLITGQQKGAIQSAAARCR